jgi:ribonuclease-3
MSTSLDELQARIEYRFKDRSLLERAVTHPSWLQDHPEDGDNNQRLEYLGDAVLQLILSEALFRAYPEEREGVLSQRRASLTKGAFLAQLAMEVGLHESLRLGSSEESAGGRTRPSALEDAFEGVIAAVYLDSNYETTRSVVLALYGSLPRRLATEKSDNPKGRLQELIQPVHGNDALRYEVVRTEGADHAREYEVEARLNERTLGSGRGTSKKLAEEAAAQAALEALRNEAPHSSEG